MNNDLRIHVILWHLIWLDYVYCLHLALANKIYRDMPGRNSVS